MKIPKLKRKLTYREYRKNSFEQNCKIVHAWLFRSNSSHRRLDREFCGVDNRKGWRSFTMLHFLGLKKDFKGIFEKCSLEQAVKFLEEDVQDFSLTIEMLKYADEEKTDLVISGLYENGKSKDNNFEKNLYLRLSELTDTDRSGSKRQTRMEQGLLRALLFENHKNEKCALCHRRLPIELMVAAHIKPRNKCSTLERVNPKIVMPVCKIGCDDFFEKGYLIVDDEGKISSNGKINNFPELNKVLNLYDGKCCTHFNKDTKKFFKDKRKDLRIRC